MIGFLEEISQSIGLPLDVLSGGFRLINLNNHAIYVEGNIKIISLSQEEIKLKLKKGILNIGGQDLKIKNMQDNTLMVVGDITELNMS